MSDKNCKLLWKDYEKYCKYNNCHELAIKKKRCVKHQVTERRNGNQ